LAFLSFAVGKTGKTKHLRSGVQDMFRILLLIINLTIIIDNIDNRLPTNVTKMLQNIIGFNTKLLILVSLF